MNRESDSSGVGEPSRVEKQNADYKDYKIRLLGWTRA
jgi:hypothetical protein